MQAAKILVVDDDAVARESVGGGAEERGLRASKPSAAAKKPLRGDARAGSIWFSRISAWARSMD